MGWLYGNIRFVLLSSLAIFVAMHLGNRITTRPGTQACIILSPFLVLLGHTITETIVMISNNVLTTMTVVIINAFSCLSSYIILYFSLTVILYFGFFCQTKFEI